MPVRLRIGELLRQEGWTIKELAERAGVAYTTAHVLATGRALRIDLDTLDRICTALGVEPGAVFVRSTESAEQDQDAGGTAGSDAVAIAEGGSRTSDRRSAGQRPAHRTSRRGGHGP